MTKDDTNDLIDPHMRADQVAQHLARCDRCQAALTKARALGPAAMANWRRVFAKCVAEERAWSK
jgi:hypothetical protein